MVISWERAVLWLSACAALLYAVLVVCVPFPFGVRGRMWKSIVTVLIIVFFYLLPRMYVYK